MLPLLTHVAACMLALGLGGDGIIDDGDPTTLPVSPNAGMTVMKPEQESTYAFTDAGLLWAPKPEETTVQEVTDGGARGLTTPHPETGVTGACAPIARKMAHRRAYLDALEKKAGEVGWDKAPQIYCGLHPDEVECHRPPTAVEQDLSDLIVDDPNVRPDTDGWLVRWTRELRGCQARQPHATPRPIPRK